MKLISIKMILEKHGLRVWQVVQAMHCSRSHFYKLAHSNFKGHEDDVRTAINDLIQKEDD